MSFAKRWGQEIATLIVAVWCAIGVSGQQGIFNMAANVIGRHKWPAAIVSVLSVMIARLRQSPLNPQS